MSQGSFAIGDFRRWLWLEDWTSLRGRNKFPRRASKGGRIAHAAWFAGSKCLATSKGDCHPERSTPLKKGTLTPKNN